VSFILSDNSNHTTPKIYIFMLPHILTWVININIEHFNKKGCVISRFLTCVQYQSKKNPVRTLMTILSKLNTCVNIHFYKRTFIFTGIYP
jgi:hypothetical protein